MDQERVNTIMKIRELLEDSNVDPLEDLMDACYSWMAMEATDEVVKLILTHPHSQQFRKPPNIKKLIRAFPVKHEDEDYKTARGMIAYSANGKKGVKAFYQSLDTYDKYAIVQKKFNPADFLLNFGALYMSLPWIGYPDTLQVKQEKEMWMKTSKYYTSIDKSEVIGYLGDDDEY